MRAYICTTCGTQFPPAEAAPPRCPICDDERQHVPPGGQRWTDLTALRVDHRNAWRRYEPDLWGVGVAPPFAIDQRALLLRTSEGNILWDCIALLDDATIDLVRALGGIAAIAISHPHFYTTMVEWAHALETDVWLHAADRAWIARSDARVRCWEGEAMALHGDTTLIRCGGHFEGATVLHWPAGASGRGALLTGDVIAVAQDRRSVSFMRSFPNLIPLPPATVRRIAAAVEPFAFDRIYGGWWHSEIRHDAKGALRRSVERYLRSVTDPGGLEEER